MDFVWILLLVLLTVELILLVLLLLFGPGLLPKIGGLLGRGMHWSRLSVSDEASEQTENRKETTDGQI